MANACEVLIDSEKRAKNGDGGKKKRIAVKERGAEDTINLQLFEGNLAPDACAKEERAASRLRELKLDIEGWERRFAASNYLTIDTLSLSFSAIALRW
jgi:hypothetical protein